MNVVFEERAIYGLLVVLGASLALFSTAFRGHRAPAPEPKTPATCPARYCPGPTWYVLVGTGEFSLRAPEGGGGHPTTTDF